MGKVEDVEDEVRAAVEMGVVLIVVEVIPLLVPLTRVDSKLRSERDDKETLTQIKSVQPGTMDVVDGEICAEVRLEAEVMLLCTDCVAVVESELGIILAVVIGEVTLPTTEEAPLRRVESPLRSAIEEMEALTQIKSEQP